MPPAGNIPDALKSQIVRNNLDSDFLFAFFRGERLTVLDSKRLTAAQLRRIAGECEEIAWTRDKRKESNRFSQRGQSVRKELKRGKQAR